jgi:hypothetical protein
MHRNSAEIRAGRVPFSKGGVGSHLGP